MYTHSDANTAQEYMMTVRETYFYLSILLQEFLVCYIFFFKVQIDTFMNIYFSIMEIAVDTYARIGRISFFTVTS
jgi:hypothetical protein